MQFLHFRVETLVLVLGANSLKCLESITMLSLLLVRMYIL